MWVKKNKEELDAYIIYSKKSSKKKRILNVLFLTLLCFLAQLITLKTGFSKFGYYKSMSWIDVISYFPIIFSTCTLIFLIFIIFKIEPFSTDYLYLCEKCNKKKLNIKKGAKCVCGGNYVDISTMKWVEDTEQPKKENDENK